MKILNFSQSWTRWKWFSSCVAQTSGSDHTKSSTHGRPDTWPTAETEDCWLGGDWIELGLVTSKSIYFKIINLSFYPIWKLIVSSYDHPKLKRDQKRSLWLGLCNLSHSSRSKMAKKCYHLLWSCVPPTMVIFFFEILRVLAQSNSQHFRL